MVKPEQLIIDHNRVPLLSIICVYTLESLQVYLEHTFQIITGVDTAKDFGKLTSHACNQSRDASTGKKWLAKYICLIWLGKTNKRMKDNIMGIGYQIAT